MDAKMFSNKMQSLFDRTNEKEAAISYLIKIANTLEKGLGEDITTSKTQQKVAVHAFNKYYAYENGCAAFSEIDGKFSLEIDKGVFYLCDLNDVKVQDNSLDIGHRETVVEKLPITKKSVEFVKIDFKAMLAALAEVLGLANKAAEKVDEDIASFIEFYTSWEGGMTPII